MSALAPIVQAGTGLVDRLGRHPGSTPKAFDHGGMRLTPIGLNAREIRASTRASPTARSGRSTTTPCDRPSSAASGGRATSRSTSASPRPTAQVASRVRRCGCTTTSCSSCPRCCAPCGPTSASASSCTSRSRRRSCSCSCRGAQSVEGMLGADLVGFQRPVAAQNFLQSAAGSSTSRRRAPPIRYQGRIVRVGAFPVVDRLREIDGIAARPETMRAAARSCATALGSPRRSCWASTGSTTPRASTCASQAFRELLQSGVTTAARDGARAGRDAEPRARRRPTGSLREQRRARGGRINGEFGRAGPPCDPLPAPQPTDGRARRGSTRGRCDARDPAARRHEPRRQGVRGSARPRWTACSSCREFAGAAGELRQALSS